ncbi:MAG: Asp-tRNA(Asn)/Glu-tRNA(Gln) amidotransferase subunit GatC [Gemmatimonadetes bacterium]|nr:Asp-tRNA(Asn)/Glu-tRNA(Gln) amidotransferase subunit GatC [Gemmatimonadota bacterium]MCC6772050.1 Asp-tRNA(Asn)/Glu-tRNA(Gln) amidotransferase subunit GatC [Gemmatimonadaceae bacterium]
MAVSDEDVRHVAALARLGLEPDRVSQLATELNGILSHMDVLAAVDTSAIDLHERGDGQGMPLRDDGEAQLPLAHGRETFAPASRDGFFLVPRLATHEDASEDA